MAVKFIIIIIIIIVRGGALDPPTHDDINIDMKKIIMVPILF